jgi:DNA-binding NarL/FixJ family response regulator
MSWRLAVDALVALALLSASAAEIWGGDPVGNGWGGPSPVVGLLALLAAGSVVARVRRPLEAAIEALRAGASGFLLKTAPADQLLSAVHLAAQGEALLSPSITRRLIEDYVRRPAPDRLGQPLDELTPRELDVLPLVARGQSNREIADELVIAPATVKSHVASLLSKLGLRDRVQLVVTACESGLVQSGARS